MTRHHQDCGDEHCRGECWDAAAVQRGIVYAVILIAAILAAAILAA